MASILIVEQSLFANWSIPKSLNIVVQEKKTRTRFGSHPGFDEPRFWIDSLFNDVPFATSSWFVAKPIQLRELAVQG